MAILAIKSHTTHGKEVIEILEMLGGKNPIGWNGSDPGLFHYIDVKGEINAISDIYKHCNYILYTLEEFLEKFPYKVGDIVKIPDCDVACRVMNMIWNGVEIEYETRNSEVTFFADELQPYKKEETFGECIEKTINECLFGKKETMEDNSTLNQLNELDSKTFSDGYDQGYDDGQHDMTEWNLPDGFIFKDENGNVINTNKIILEKKKPKYPKTYEECCDVLKIEYPYFKIEEDGISASTYKNKLFGALKQLLICRDAYWKLAGEEMGLNEPWEPDWTNLDKLKYCILVDVGEFITTTNVRGQHILAFPTPEMRDAFSDSEEIAQLIENCKEFL